MPTLKTASPDIASALRFWTEYQRDHDVSAYEGQTVAIDPVGRRVWFGERASDIKRQLQEQEIQPKVILIRVGSDSYMRKGNQKSWGVM